MFIVVINRELINAVTRLSNSSVRSKTLSLNTTCNCVLQHCRQLTADLQTSKYILNSELPPDVSTGPTILTSTSGPPTLMTSIASAHAEALPTVTGELTTSSVSVTGVSLPQNTEKPQLTASCQSLTTSTSSCVSPTSTAMSTNSVQTLKQTASASESTMPQTSADALQISSEHAVQMVNTNFTDTELLSDQAAVAGLTANARKKSDDVTEDGEKTGAVPGTSKLGDRVDANVVEDNTATDEPEKVLPILHAEQDAKDSMMAPLALSTAEQCEGLKADDADEVVASTNNAAAASTNSSEVTLRNQSSVAVDKDKSDVVLADEMAEAPSVKDGDNVDTGSSEQTTEEPGSTESWRKDDENEKSNVSDEEMQTEMHETISDKKSHHVADVGSDEKVGSVADAAEPSSKGDARVDRKDTTESSLKKEPLRQVMTLPTTLLSHLNLSQPISVSLSQHCHITVPACNVYRSALGLRLLLPPDSLPVEYVDNQQLSCKLGHTDVGIQLITVSLSLH